MTADEFARIDDWSHRHELIKGELLTMPLPKDEHGRAAFNLMILLGQHVKTNRLGRVFAEVGYRIESDPDTILGPDVSFRRDDHISTEGYHPGPPDLVIEVISPGDRRSKIERKLGLCLEAGARSVWHVNPRRRTVEIISSTGERRTFHENDELFDDTVPGFRVKVSEIFE
jgi:Uma2 family endonuclease